MGKISSYLYSVQRCAVIEQDKMTRIWLVASHVGWIICLYQAYIFHNWWLFGMAATTITLSSLYHYKGILSLEVLDTTFACIYLLLGPFLLLRANASLYEWIAGIMIVIAALSIYTISWLRRRQRNCDVYVGWHALWHLAAAFLTVFIYAVYFDQIAF